MAINIFISKVKQFISRDTANKELLSESVIAFFIRSLSALVAFAVNVVIGRYLGAVESGYFFLALSLITILTTFCRMGSENIMLRYISIHYARGENNEMQSIVLLLLKRTFLFSLVITPILVFSSHIIATLFFKQPALENTLIWMGLSTPFFTGYMLLSYSFQGIKKVSHSVVMQGTLLSFLLIICTIIFSPEYSSQLSVIYFLLSVVTFITGYIVWRKITQGHAVTYTNKAEVIKESRPLWTVAILQQCIQWGGQFVAGIYVKPEHLAQLAVAQRTSMLISFVLLAVNLVSAPRFASYYHANEIEKLKRYVTNTTRLLVVISLPLVIVILLFAPQIMELFGKDFRDGSMLLRILALGQFVSMVSGSVGYLLMMSGHQKDMRNINIINGILAIILYVVLIPPYGAMGAAIATAIAVASQNLMAVRQVKKRIGINTLTIWK